MIRHVTEAIKSEIGRQLGAQPLHGSKTDWHASLPDDWEPNSSSLDLSKIARAAIEAIREPTGHMVAAAWAWADYESSPKGVLVEEFSVGRNPDDLTQDTAYEVWRAMIEAALKEPA